MIPWIGGGQEGHSFQGNTSAFQPPALTGGESVQLDGLSAQQKEDQLVRREHVHTAFLQGQHRALIL